MAAKKVQAPHVTTPNQKKYIRFLEKAQKSAQDLRAKYYREGERLQRIADKTGSPEDHFLAMRVSGISSKYRELEMTFDAKIKRVKNIGWVERA